MMDMMTKLWILICLLINKETLDVVSTDFSVELGATVKLPCRTKRDAPVDWRYQRDPTVVEEYVCAGDLDTHTTHCEYCNRWPRVNIIDASTPGDYTLTIYNVTVSDVGLYHCVENCGTGIRHTNRLNISAPDTQDVVSTDISDELGAYTVQVVTKDKAAESNSTVFVIVVIVTIFVTLVFVFVFVVVAVVVLRRRGRHSDDEEVTLKLLAPRTKNSTESSPATGELQQQQQHQDQAVQKKNEIEVINMLTKIKPLLDSSADMKSLMEEVRELISTNPQLKEEILSALFELVRTLFQCNLRVSEVREGSVTGVTDVNIKQTDVIKKFQDWPYELMEIVLTKTVNELFKSVEMIKSSDNDYKQCLITVMSVHVKWWQVINIDNTQCRRILRPRMDLYIGQFLKFYMSSFRHTLRSIIDPDCGLLDQLVYVTLLSPEELTDINKKPTTTERTDKLLDSLLAKDGKQCRLFVRTLRRTGQVIAVSKLYNQAADNPPLHSKYRSLLDVNAASLVDLLDLDHGLLEQLHSTGCITLQHTQHIASGTTVSDRSNRLLDIVRRRSDANYEQFIKCIEYCDQKHVARILKQKQVVVNVDIELAGEDKIDVRRKAEQLVKAFKAKSKKQELGSALSAQLGPDLEVVDTKTQDFRVRMYLVCKSVAAIHHLDELFVDNKFTNIIKHVLDISFVSLGIGCSVKKIMCKTEDYLRCVRYFHLKMDLLRDIYSVDGWSNVDNSDLKNIESFTLELLPVDLMEIVLTRAAVLMFTSLGKMTSRADVIAVMTLNAVCVNWRNIITHPKLSITTHWRHAMQSVVRPYRLQPKLLFTVQGQDRRVTGLTVLDNKLYVVYDMSATVDVYLTQQQPYTRTHNLHITGLNDPNDIAAGNYSKCLYIADWRRCVWRVTADHKNHKIDKWMELEDVAKISEAANGQITMLIGVDYQGHWPNATCRGQLKVYSPDRKLLRTVDLSRDLVSPFHALQTANNSFIVCHGSHNTEVNRVCEVNIDGVVLKSYGGSRGAGLRQLDTLRHIALDDNQQILVADTSNGRVLLLNTELIIERVLLTWSRDRPWRVFYNSETRQLLVGLESGKVDVYNVQ